MDGIRKLRMTLLGIKDLSSLVEFSKHYWTDMNYIQRPCNLDAEKLKFKSEIFLFSLVVAWRACICSRTKLYISSVHIAILHPILPKGQNLVAKSTILLSSTCP